MNGQVMKALVLYPDSFIPVKLDVYDTLETLQAFVGGLIEVVSLDDEIDIILNEEGLLLHLPINMIVDEYSVFVGPLMFVGHDDEGNFISLTTEQMKRVDKFIDDNYHKKMFYLLGFPLEEVLKLK